NKLRKMAGSFSNAKTVISVFRRGYAAVSQAAAGVPSSVRTGAPNMMLKKKKGSSDNESSWGPDPITGYYRPENQAKEIDAAELREMLVNNKNRRN
ncbi:hypothetical protein ABTP16_20225, partial [Acinetobacter baumannii]